MRGGSIFKNFLSFEDYFLTKVNFSLNFLGQGMLSNATVFLFDTKIFFHLQARVRSLLRPPHKLHTGSSASVPSFTRSVGERARSEYF